jgi:hypothetical protein
MLPPGLTADLAPSSLRNALQQLHPSAKTVAQLLVGACSCDLVRTRSGDPIADERELRSRYHALKLTRNEMITELERHRSRSTPGPRSSSQWAAALTDFVAEHGRNAGPTLYLLEFTARRIEQIPRELSTPTARTLREVRARDSAWLQEGRPVIVS